MAIDPIKTVAVLGAGAWGTALAQVAASAGRRVMLWAREPEVVASVNERRENELFLPGIALHEGVVAVQSLSAAVGADLILAAPPAQHMRAVLRDIASQLPESPLIAACSKGVELGSLALMTDVLMEEVPSARQAVLSGPGFAKDVARNLPTAVTLAAKSRDDAMAIADAISMPTFRPYLSDDLTGAEIGGAVKNVIAIACGVAEGREMGHGARAALITRGFAELMRLGVAMGARAETLSGLCGLGDLVLTCNSETSRNMSLGAELGRGRTMDEILGERRTVAEGAASAPAVMALAKRYGLDLPICGVVEAIVTGAMDVDAAIDDLLSRPIRSEGF